MSDLDQTLRFPASIQVRKTDEQLLTLLEKRVGKSRAEAGDAFFWSARISNTELDSYFTHMRPSSLKNYARDAKSGVPFQDSHNTRSIIHTLGRSLSGEYVPLNDDDYAEVLSDFYTFRNRDQLIDSFINKVEDALVNDVSVGFIPGRMICSICNRDMMKSWDCYHWPGFEYSKDAQDRESEKILCTAAVEDGRLVEVSTVYAGSTPGASLIKAQRMVEAGKMPLLEAKRLEEVYNVRILGSQQVFLPANMEDRSMPGALGQGSEKPAETAPVIDEAQIAQRVAEAVAKVEGEHATTHRDLSALLASKNLVKGTLVDSVRAIIDERDSLVAPAAEGKQYRKDLIASALVEGVRAFGNDFQRETYERLLEGATLDVIKQMNTDWGRVAAKEFSGGAKFNGGGGTTVEEKDPSRYRA